MRARTMSVRRTLAIALIATFIVGQSIMAAAKDFPTIVMAFYQSSEGLPNFLVVKRVGQRIHFAKCMGSPANLARCQTVGLAQGYTIEQILEAKKRASFNHATFNRYVVKPIATCGFLLGATIGGTGAAAASLLLATLGSQMDMLGLPLLLGSWIGIVIGIPASAGFVGGHAGSFSADATREYIDQKYGSDSFLAIAEPMTFTGRLLKERSGWRRNDLPQVESIELQGGQSVELLRLEQTSEQVIEMLEALLAQIAR